MIGTIDAGERCQRHPRSSHSIPEGHEVTGKIYNDITEVVGRTPLVKLGRINETGANIFAKLEFFGPGSSVKDRLGLGIIRAAEQSGELQPGGTIVEGTSGNTGIALAMLGASRGYRVILAMPETMSIERRQLLKAFGAELVLTPGPEGMRGAVARAKQIVDETPGAILARQFENEANVQIHRETTAEEIWADTDGEIDIFVAGVGTGGTISGVGQVLKERKPEVKIVAVEPKDSPLLTEGKAGPHKIQGLGANFVPDVLDRDVIDEVLDATLEDSIRVSRALTSTEGIFSGISSGANLWAALEIAKRPENAGKNIVVIICDTGERYLSTVLFDDLRD
ncbi:cysteine synthase A [Pseudoclavibacter terrae]|uniref:Cysteine synthase n=1 Tax=Pseudoclavibacter terrae TaxID=1530195 RepID=A0A7J5B7Z2_9MICO|nr:cysteine synthase A [Pseudoclavibacter terrae]MBS3177642.1 cysteine synthase A [Pseudoclavibacter sp. Marseille-Q4354]PPG29587.1 cysteine synthase A [Pseudoclavibacter sp. RFBB5]PPG39392.1 cysteine synthase A [Pseudoclavibacter sp. RFBA6]